MVTVFGFGEQSAIDRRLIGRGSRAFYPALPQFSFSKDIGHMKQDYFGKTIYSNDPNHYTSSNDFQDPKPGNTRGRKKIEAYESYDEQEEQEQDEDKQQHIAVKVEDKKCKFVPWYLAQHNEGKSKAQKTCNTTWASEPELIKKYGCTGRVRGKKCSYGYFSAVRASWLIWRNCFEQVRHMTLECAVSMSSIV